MSTIVIAKFSTLVDEGFFDKPSTQSPMQKWIFNYSIKKLRKNISKFYVFV